jgi:predicted kinase
MEITHNSKPEFIMVVGLPGSGKSTYIDKYYSKYKVHSSDSIREELSGDVTNQDINKKVFNLLHTRVKEDLSNGISCCYDATNINWKRRKSFLQELNKIDCWKYCIVIATPFEMCLEQNDNRDRKVPYEVIERMYTNFDIPWYNEGWDSIFIAYTNASYTNSYGHWDEFILKTLIYEQDSVWHKKTLGEHSLATLEYVQSKVNELSPVNERETKIASALHDCGKPFVKCYVDSKGNPSTYAHYYNHENVGAYNSLFYGKEDGVDNLLVAALIQYHMILHFFKDWKQKTIDKYENEFTSHKYLKEMEFYKALKILHDGDKSAH